MSARQGRKACTVAASVVLAKRWKLLLENVAGQKRKKDAQQLGTQWWIKNYQSTRRRKCIATNIMRIARRRMLATLKSAHVVCILIFIIIIKSISSSIIISISISISISMSIKFGQYFRH